ncbi:stalk domain-containing protein [Paenibacillus pini]
MKKTIVSMMVLGMTLTGVSGVYAGTNLQKITAYLNHNIGIQVNGSTYTPTDGKGNKLAPITYKDTTYLPVRAVADALKVPVSYDAASHQVNIGSNSSITLSKVTYSSTQVAAIRKEFAKFKSFETAYAPQLMAKGDAYQKAGASDDSVYLIFKHMRVGISPRDYSNGYTSKPVKLSNGIQAKWYTPDKTPMLGFKLNDRYVTISSEDHILSQAQIEQVAASVAKLK